MILSIFFLPVVFATLRPPATILQPCGLPHLLLKQIRECLLCVGGRAGRSFAFDDCTRGEQLASIASPLVHDARRERFAAFETRARIKVSALPARVQVSVALRAGTVVTDRRGDYGSASRALYLLAKCHHPGRPRTLTIAARLRLLWFGSLLAPSIIFLIAALAIFTLAHVCLRSTDGRCSRSIREIGRLASVLR